MLRGSNADSSDPLGLADLFSGSPRSVSELLLSSGWKSGSKRAGEESALRRRHSKQRTPLSVSEIIQDSRPTPADRERFVKRVRFLADTSESLGRFQSDEMETVYRRNRQIAALSEPLSGFKGRQKLDSNSVWTNKFGYLCHRSNLGIAAYFNELVGEGSHSETHLMLIFDAAAKSVFDESISKDYVLPDFVKCSPPHRDGWFELSGDGENDHQFVTAYKDDGHRSDRADYTLVAHFSPASAGANTSAHYPKPRDAGMIVYSAYISYS